MYTYVLQDWITIRGSSTGSGATIIQTQADWLDLSPFQDVFFYIAVSELTGTVNMSFETSPSLDDPSSAGGVSLSLFTPVMTATQFASVPTTVTVVKAPMLSASCPISRYLRWKLTSSSATPWDMTFRVLVAANSPGMG
jgi:hypothetical protein